MTPDWVVGADVGGTGIKFAVLSADSAVVLKGEVATDPTDPERSLRRLAEAVRRQLGSDFERLAAVGLACAGIISARTGRLGRSPNLVGFEGADLADTVRHSFGSLPAVFANDVNGGLYGEWRMGAGRGCRNLVMIALGTGVGGAVLVDGRLITGAADGAGEIGHMVLDPAGTVCPCGNRGCLEAYAGGNALLQQARDRAAGAAEATALFRQTVREEADTLSCSTLFRLASQGDRTATAVFEEAGIWLGQAVANLVNVLDPERVIIGGGVAQAGELVLGPCRTQVRKLVLSEGGRQVPVVPAELGPFAAALGAAVLAAEKAVRR